MADELLNIALVVCLGPRCLRTCELRLPAGATVEQALTEVRSQHPDGLGADNAVEVGIWGRKAGFDQVLRDGDRLELYRALRVDPKVARRERFKAQGARGTGLFAKRRSNAASG